MKSIAVKHPRKFFTVLGLLIADGIVFGSTDATKVVSFVLIVGFILLMATIYNLLYGLLSALRLYGVTIRRKKRLASSLTALLACLVALQSVGELNLRDVLVLLPLVLIGYTYSFYSIGTPKPDA